MSGSSVCEGGCTVAAGKDGKWLRCCPPDMCMKCSSVWLNSSVKASIIASRLVSSLAVLLAVVPPLSRKKAGMSGKLRLRVLNAPAPASGRRAGYARGR